jgi:hypothetical protein
LGPIEVMAAGLPDLRSEIEAVVSDEQLWAIV